MTDMLKKSEKINTSNESVKSDTLTEQWKKGELPTGHYWVTLQWQDGVFVLYYDEGYGFDYSNQVCDFEDVKEVLAKVPSFDGFLTLVRAYNTVVDENTKLKETLRKTKANGHYPDRISRLKSRVVATSEENTKLKELLKECKDEIEYLRKHYKGIIDHFKNNTGLDKEINQVLQGKE